MNISFVKIIYRQLHIYINIHTKEKELLQQGYFFIPIQGRTKYTHTSSSRTTAHNNISWTIAFFDTISPSKDDDEVDSGEDSIDNITI